MRLHPNARTCPHSRLLIATRVLESGWSLARAAEAAGVSERTARKWVRRYREHGQGGLVDRSSAPELVANRTPESGIEAITKLRRLRMSGEEIAEALRMPLSTLGGILTRIGLGKRSSLEPREPPLRYEKAQPGELVHIDVKRLAGINPKGRHDRHNPAKPTLRSPGRAGRRNTGWDYLHIAVDDATRLAYAEVLPNEKAKTASGFLTRARAYYKQRWGITISAVMTDNGPAYTSHLHALVCHTLGLKHKRTRPYRPQTNGKAERLIRTLTDGWAYATIYTDSHEREQALPHYLDYHNRHRPHKALNRQTPAQRLLQAGTTSSGLTCRGDTCVARSLDAMTACPKRRRPRRTCVENPVHFSLRSGAKGHLGTEGWPG